MSIFARLIFTDDFVAVAMIPPAGLFPCRKWGLFFSTGDDYYFRYYFRYYLRSGPRQGAGGIISTTKEFTGTPGTAPEGGRSNENTMAEKADIPARLAGGELELFNELVRSHHASLFRLANSLLRNVDDAQEVVQEAFLAAYEGRKSFKGRSDIKTWLLSITYNKTMDHLKRSSRDRWLIDGELKGSPLWENVVKVRQFTDWGRNPEQNYHNAELMECLENALQALPAESKAVYELRNIQGLSSNKVAETLAISEGAVRVRLHRVRQYLLVALESFFEGKGKSR